MGLGGGLSPKQRITPPPNKSSHLLIGATSYIESDWNWWRFTLININTQLYVLLFESPPSALSILLGYNSGGQESHRDGYWLNMPVVVSRSETWRCESGPQVQLIRYLGSATCRWRHSMTSFIVYIYHGCARWITLGIRNVKRATPAH